MNKHLLNSINSWHSQCATFHSDKIKTVNVDVQLPEPMVEIKCNTQLSTLKLKLNQCTPCCPATMRIEDIPPLM